MEDVLIAPSPWLLAAGLAADVLLGDPVYRWHPVRLIGRSITRWEGILRAAGLDGRTGGVVLCFMAAGQWLAAMLLLLWLSAAVHKALALAVHLYLVYSMMALGDLLEHVGEVGRNAERGDLDGARQAVARLVGRDVDRMDLAACRRAAIESLAENFTDGVLSPIFWYWLAGLPGMVIFKVSSTLDSMVGYRTPRYLHFGWCAARWDDAMNYVPARLSALLVAAAAALLPSCSARKALGIALRDHGLVPGPNSGWSEAAVAGAIGRRLAGPIFAQGRLVNDMWIGAVGDSPAGEGGDLRNAQRVVAVASLLAALAAIGGVWLYRPLLSP
ncbi:MAG: adenosylcobinamide-phosphate synthase CbiB [Bryobacterales bacterium]|nr:adenosylcobinamide-phosphate synthase CbiB [Bryobacteraceae bacterium]MDW8356101.1 adenosylcobinamide-phosphate synthase CbiB [Bryobacterales bacterium]